MILDHKLQRMLNDSKIAQLNSERPLQQTAVSWESPVTTHNPPVKLQVNFHGFQNSRLVFHGSMLAFIGF